VLLINEHQCAPTRHQPQASILQPQAQLSAQPKANDKLLRECFFALYCVGTQQNYYGNRLLQAHWGLEPAMGL
jgi:hypothetical protein